MEDEFAAAAGSPVEVASVGTAFEAVGGGAVKPQGASGRADGHGREGGGFDEDGRGGVGDFCVEAAHDAGDGNGALGISDDAHAGVEFVITLVDGADFFAGGSAADDDLLAIEFVEIEGVEWLTAFEHNVVGDVDDVIHGIDADGGESVAEPCGAGADANATDEPSVVFGAEVIGFDPDRDSVGHWLAGFGDGC